MRASTTCRVALMFALAISAAARSRADAGEDMASSGRAASAAMPIERRGAEEAFDEDDPSALFTTNQPLPPPGVYTDDAAKTLVEQILPRLLRANHYWLMINHFTPLAASCSLIRYTHADEPSMTAVDLSSNSGPARLFSHVPYTNHAWSFFNFLQSDQQRSVAVTEHDLRVDFKLSRNPNYQLSIGVQDQQGPSPYRPGRFSLEPNEGMVYLDRVTYTPTGIKFASGEMVRYGDFVKMPDGSFVPRLIQYVNGDILYTLRFEVFRPDWWVLMESEYTAAGERVSATATTNLIIGGQPAQPLLD